MVQITDFDALRRDGYTAAEQADIEAFIAESGADYETITDLLADYTDLQD